MKTALQIAMIGLFTTFIIGLSFIDVIDALFTCVVLAIMCAVTVACYE
jgi:hypothetical protein